MLTAKEANGFIRAMTEFFGDSTPLEVDLPCQVILDIVFCSTNMTLISLQGRQVQIWSTWLSQQVIILKCVLSSGAQ